MYRYRRLAIIILVLFLVGSSASATIYSAGDGARTAISAGQQTLKEHPVVLVHGLNSTMDTWTDKTTIFHSLQDAGYDMTLVERFAYPAGPGQEDGSGDVTLIAHRLMAQIEALSQRSVAQGGPARVDIIAHSLGGLATRYLLGRSTSDGNGAIYTDGRIGKFIDIGTPHSGSGIADAYYRGIGALADWVTVKPLNWVVEEAINQLVGAVIREFDFSVPDPTTPAARQLDPNSTFIQQLNQPGNSPGSIDYSILYGDISLRFGWDLFDIPILSQELVSIGDSVVSRDNAATIPHLGSRLGPNPSNYHVYEYAAPITLKLKMSLFDPGIEIPGLSDIKDEIDLTWHGGLLSNPEVNQQIMRILEANTSLPSPAPAPPVINAGSSTATVLLLDISGSMGDPWQGGIKIESAKNAAADIVTMMEQESSIGGVEHSVGVASFSSGAWLNLSLTSDYQGARDTIADLFADAGTDIGAGIQIANEALRLAPSGAQRIMILLSDGMTNEGLSPPEILSGPVQDAVVAGTCIYTVGFGNPGDLDEAFLRQIADASGCGEYYYASDAYQLDQIYIRLRHQSIGQVVADFTGVVGQGETTPPKTFEVSTGQGELGITLHWKGSALDLVMTDPNGRKVDDRYPGAIVKNYARFVYLIIQNPPSGLWKLSVFGRDVPEGILDYNAIASVRQGAGQQMSQPSTKTLVAIVGVIAVVALILAVLALARPGRGYPPGLLPGRRAGVEVRQGRGPAGVIGFRQGALRVGREPGVELVLQDPKASRRHAQIRREADGYVLYDMGSTNKTYVNGRPVSRCLLKEGDEIRVGNTVLVFHDD